MLLHPSSIPSPSMGILWDQKNFLTSMALGKSKHRDWSGLLHIFQSHWGVCLHWFLFAPFNYSYGKCKCCLKMTILYECHVCIKKFLKLLCNSHWGSVKSFNKDKIKSFIQSNLEGKQQEKKKFGDCWQLLFPPGEISIQSHGQALF